MIDLTAFPGYDPALMPESCAVAGHPNGVFLVVEYDEPSQDNPGQKDRKTILFPHAGAKTVAEAMLKEAEDAAPERKPRLVWPPR